MKTPAPKKSAKKGHIPAGFLAHMKHKGEGKAPMPHAMKTFPPKGPMTAPPLDLSPVPEEPSKHGHMGATIAVHKKHVGHAHKMIHGTSMMGMGE